MDDAGNRTAKQNLLSGVTDDYTYDLIYQLTQVTQGGNTTESYTYDAVGNRLSSLGLSPYQYNNSNELTSIPNATFTHDNNGNTLTKTDSSGVTNYTWDYENRLTSVTLPGTAGTVTFKYDPFGRRIQKSGPTGITNYLYDGANVVTDLDASGAVTASYAQGSGIDEPLASVTAAGTVFFEADGLGSITSLSGMAGITDTYTYDAFGVTTATGANTNRFRYTGREWDSETGLYYYRARYYDPQIGRFILEDPLQFDGTGTDFYAYGGNDPIDNVDPSGCGYIDCAKALAELARAVAELTRREAENAAAGKCDKGHDKAIEQAKKRVQNALAKARTCPQEEVKKILDQLKRLDQSIVNGIVNWLNNDPRQNWPGIYGPMPSIPGVPPPVLPPTPVPIPIVP